MRSASVFGGTLPAAASIAHILSLPLSSAPSLISTTVSPCSICIVLALPVTLPSMPMGKLSPSKTVTTPCRTRNDATAPALNKLALPVYKFTVTASSVAPLSLSPLSASATLTRRAASLAAKPAVISFSQSVAAKLPSTAA